VSVAAVSEDYAFVTFSVCVCLFVCRYVCLYVCVRCLLSDNRAFVTFLFMHACICICISAYICIHTHTRRCELLTHKYAHTSETDAHSSYGLSVLSPGPFYAVSNACSAPAPASHV
jgi:hypothetical protein